MSHKDSIPSPAHASPDLSAYNLNVDKIPKESSQLGDMAADSSAAQSEESILHRETALLRGTYPDDNELLKLITSEEGAEILELMCKNDSLRNILISFSHDTNNPLIREQLSSIILSHGLDSASFSHTQLEDVYSPNTPFLNLLETKPDSDELLSRLVIRMQSRILVETLLLEFRKNPSSLINDFILDTLPKINSSIVIPEILEFKKLSSTQSNVLSQLIIQIQQEYSSGIDTTELHSEHSIRAFSPEATEPRRYIHDPAGRKENYAASVDGQGASPEFDEKIDINGVEEKVEDITSWGQVKVEVNRIVSVVKDVLAVDWISKIFHVDWVRNSFNRTIQWLERSHSSQVIDELRFEYNMIIKQMNNPEQPGIGLPDQQLDGAQTLCDFLRNNNDPEAWQILKEFFIACPDPNNVKTLFIEIQKAPPEIKELIIQLIVKMNPSATIPVLLDNHLNWAKMDISINELLGKIEKRHIEKNILRETHQSPSFILRLLSSDNERLQTVISEYLASQSNIGEFIPSILHNIEYCIGNGTMSSTDIDNAIRLFSRIGPKSIPVMLEFQNNHDLKEIIDPVIAAFKDNETV